MKIAFCTLGCKVNQYETDLLKERAENLGYQIVNFESHSNIYVINSCSVTNMSDRKTRQMISKAKNTNNNSIIVVIGCNVDSVKDIKALSEYNADILLGNKDKLDLFEEIERYRQIDKKTKIIKVSDISTERKYKEKYRLKKGYDIREAVKIEDGCDNFCSYCIIPYLRGRIRSKNKQDVINEIQSLVKNGVKEVVLVGIEVTSYGKDLKNITLIDIIEEINKIKGLERIRLSSLDPRYLNEANLIQLSKITKLCNYFHISMQSLDNDILKFMNRKYTVKDIQIICKNIKKYFKDAYIATDVIVGFPGETDEMFNNTVANLKKIDLAKIHVFKYSKREGTTAAKMPNQIEGNIKKQRSKEILKLSNELQEKYLKQYIGKDMKVLFEHFENDINTGITSNYIKVVVKGSNNLCGTVQDVVGISLNKESIIGKMK